MLCEPGLVCGHDAWFTGEHRCEVPYPSGDRCHVAIPEGCPAREVCDGERCVPLRGEGQPCATAERGARCGPSLYCDESTSVCTRLRRLGESCTLGAADRCESWRCSRDGVCVEITIAYCRAR